MDSDDDDGGFNNPSALGLQRILQDVGIDTSTLTSVFGSSGEAGGAVAIVDAEVSDGEDRYEDEVSDPETAGEAEERRVRARRQVADEARWMKRAMEMQQAVPRPVKVREKEAETAEMKVRKVWPEWEPGQRMRMTEVFYDTPMMQSGRDKELRRAKRQKLEHTSQRTYTITVAPDTSLSGPQLHIAASLPELQIHDAPQAIYETPLGEYFDKEWIKGARAVRRREMLDAPNRPDLGEDNQHGDAPRPLDMVDWESQIVFNTETLPAAKPLQPLKPRNEFLDSSEWLNEIIWDASRIYPDLVAVDDDEVVAPPRPTPPALTGKLDRFNISNDHLYEHSREARFKIRQTFGAIEVFHSAPAKNLQMPYYKTSLTKSEQRSWKRPAMQFPVGISLGFTKLRSNPISSNTSRKKAMMTDPSERFKSSKDLTMTEKGPYVLLEFSEEYPPLMSGYGMGTTIVNYYRKKDDKDDHVPKLDLGQPSILNVGDAEPFLLGYVDKGKVTQVIHNNLIRAPIYRHTPETTDFLVIRHTVNGHATYHIRPISNLYTVGQTFPNESEVPGPHARKNTNYAKTRLQIVAWLLINKSKHKRLRMTNLLKYFPDQTELQMRQRLKIKGQEFLLYNRSNGPNQNFWILNPAYPNPWPSERAEVLQQTTPEFAMMFEAMQVGARHLYDAGYTKTAEGKDEEDPNDESGLDIEQKLAVWSTTLNYKKAEQAKAWLVVHGDGDPTGRGEGWAFLRANMKGYFLRAGETEMGRRLEAEHKANGAPVKISNAEQNRIYEDEKRRIWDLQAKALSNPVPPEIALNEEDHPLAGATPVGFGPRYTGRADNRRAFSRSNSMAATPFMEESPRGYSPAPSAGETSFTGNNAPKVMRIKRMIKGKLHVEIVRDPQIILSYRRRVEDHKIEEFRNQADNLVPTGNQAEDELKKAALMQELENVKKNQARRLARKKYSKQAAHGINPEDYDPDLDVGKRRCGACGQMGHTKANRNCPMFDKSHAAGQSPLSTTQGTGMTPGGWQAGAGDYFGTGNQGMTPTDGGATPSLKIRLGMGGQK